MEEQTGLERKSIGRKRKSKVGQKLAIRKDRQEKLIVVEGFVSVTSLFKTLQSVNQYPEKKCVHSKQHLCSLSDLEALSVTCKCFRSLSFKISVLKATQITAMVFYTAGKGKSQRLKKMFKFKFHVTKSLEISSVRLTLMTRPTVKPSSIKLSSEQ
jgi:hypothetical protein